MLWNWVITNISSYSKQNEKLLNFPYDNILMKFFVNYDSHSLFSKLFKSFLATFAATQRISRSVVKLWKIFKGEILRKSYLTYKVLL